jgi:hypothetical protein
MKKALLIFCFLFACLAASAQTGTTKTISVNLQGVTVGQFVNELESKTAFRFYFDPAQMDSVRITVQADNKPLETVLDMAFQSTDLHYAISLDNDVFITKGHEIKTTLASGFLNDQAVTVQKGQNGPAEFIDDNVKETPKATMENKLYEIGAKSNNPKTGNIILAGYVRDVKTGEPLTGVSVYDEALHTGIATDQFGYYSLSLPAGRHILVLKSAGMKDTRRQVLLYSNGKLNIDVQQQVLALREVVISAKNAANVNSVQMGVNHLDIASIKQVPAVFGEADILRAVLTLPGVQSVGESSVGFNVRGGSADQNLILLNGLTIYNPAHFFGFFSAFNPDIVKDIELYKSTIPEKYGGRLSSVLDVTNREGNSKTFSGSAGIGLLTSRLNIEGPIIKNSTSFIFGGRTSYSDWLLSLLPNDYKHSKASFYDLNLDITSQINEKNTIYLTTYMSNDNFKLNSDTNYSYTNKNAALKWKHNFNNKIYGVFSIGYDRYQYDVSSDAVPLTAYKFGFDINQYNLKTDFTYYLSSKHTLDFGLSSIYYKIDPGSNQPDNAQSVVTPVVIHSEQALESALYLGDKYDITSNLSVNVGLRYSIYNYLGPQTVNYYAPGGPREESTFADSVRYGKNKVIKTYGGPEIRLAARYNLADDLSLKASYNTLRQYIHLLSNTTAISPTDIYKLSDPNIRPQYGDQVSLGLYKNLSSNTIETSVEVYYKRLKDYLDYKSGATLVLNPHIETDVINTEGKAYGVEFMLKKTTGKLNGWVTYTYSRILLRQDDPTVVPAINSGNYYPADYDKPHAFNFISNYRVSHRFSASLNVVYSTGRPITLPVAKYYYAGSERVLYSDRNQYRIPDYFRTDFSINIEGNHKIHQLSHNSWSIGVYNLTGRANAYSTYFTSEASVVNGYQLSIFAKPIPFINYNIRF